MANYYDVALTTAIPHGSSILNQPCSVVFTYPGGSHSTTYNGSVLAWRTANVICMASAYMNLEASWVGANGGTLTIIGAGNYQINNFVRTP